MSLVCCCLLIKPMDEQVPRYEEDATPQDRETETEQDSQAKIPIKRTKHNSRSAWVKRIHLELNHFVKANSHLLSHYLQFKRLSTTEIVRPVKIDENRLARRDRLTCNQRAPLGHGKGGGSPNSSALF